MFEICVIKRKKIILVDSIYIWSLFKAILCWSVKLRNIFEKRKSCQILNLRPYEISTLSSKKSSGSSTLCSITSLCFGIAQKHLKGILWIFEKKLQFPEKNNNFLKKLRLFHFMFVFFPDSFLVSPEGPQIPKKTTGCPEKYNHWGP